MDLMTIDLRGHPDARAGDPVVLWGVGLPIESVAEASGTIAYELSCSITRRVRFVVVYERTWARWPSGEAPSRPSALPRNTFGPMYEADGRVLHSSTRSTSGG